LYPDEFLVTGVDASISFHLAGKSLWMRSEIPPLNKVRMRTVNGSFKSCGMATKQIVDFVFTTKPKSCACAWDAFSANQNVSVVKRVQI
jgi:hypothetical protein